MTNLRKPTFNKPLLISRKQKKNALFTIVLGSMITFLCCAPLAGQGTTWFDNVPIDARVWKRLRTAGCGTPIKMLHKSRQIVPISVNENSIRRKGTLAVKRANCGSIDWGLLIRK